MKDVPQKRLTAKPKVIFMGTPEFSVPALKALAAHHYDVLAVVTQPDRPKGRGKRITQSPIKRAAADYGFEILQPWSASTPQFCDLVRDKSPDILVVVAFGQILKKAVLDIPSWGALNIHASLLPKYRGAAPIHWVILNNEAKTGLSAMRMDEGLDSGPVLLQQKVSILPDETAGQLHDRLSALAGDFLIRTLDALVENRLDEKPQDHTAATYAPKIDRGVSLIQWNNPAEKVSALIRAFDPWPGAFTRFRGKDIKCFSSRVVDNGRVGIPGRVSGFDECGLEVETGKGAIQIRALQIPGKKRLPAKDFLLGFPIEKGALLGI